MKKIEIVVLTKKTKKDNREFKVYCAYKNGEFLSNIKFVKDCVPVKENGIIEVEDGDVFKSNKTEYLTYCIKNYKSFKPATIYIKPKDLPFEEA